MLTGLGDAESAPHQADDTDDKAEAVGPQPVDVLLDLDADDGELGERRVQQALLEMRVVPHHEPEGRDQQQQQGEEREEAVVRQQGGEGATPVVAVFLHYPEEEGERPVTLLVVVEGPDRPLGWVHAFQLPT